MTPWQEYLFACFREKEYVGAPDCSGDLSTMHRHATWDAFVYDTIKCNGTQMATILSMVYRPKVVVEFGLDAGLATLQFCKLNPEAQVYGVDLRSRNYNTGLPICYHALVNDVRNLTLVVGRPSWEFRMQGQVDLCFIDGEHCGDGPMMDSGRAWDNRNSGGDWCIAWDDYHKSNPDVVRAADYTAKVAGMQLNQVGSWFYIGTIPHDQLRSYGCTT